MRHSSLLFLGITLLLLLVFAGLVLRTCSRKRRRQMEEPKYRMLDDE